MFLRRAPPGVPPARSRRGRRHARSFFRQPRFVTISFAFALGLFAQIRARRASDRASRARLRIGARGAGDQRDHALRRLPVARSSAGCSGSVIDGLLVPPVS